MKIAVYITSDFAKSTYKKECFDVRQNAGIMVVADILRRNGYEVGYASKLNVCNYDLILFSITSDCDFWTFARERIKWKNGNYKVILGGAGVLNVRPFLNLADYFVLGRAENVIAELVLSICENRTFDNKSVIESKTFSVDKEYYINQVDESYKYEIKLANGKLYKEDQIGCNHKCNFCGYTWHRKFNGKTFEYGSGLWLNKDTERAILDMESIDIDYTKLRTTAIDGMSERLRYMCNKRISRDNLKSFYRKLIENGKPHQLKLFNLVGLPSETYADWDEFIEDLKCVDAEYTASKQFCILLHSTPFRAMPATPFACKEMAYKNYRGMIARYLGNQNYKGNIFFQGNRFWGVESMGTDSLSCVIKSAIVWRGTENDADNFCLIASSKKYETLSSFKKQKVLEKYFDVAKLFRAQTAKELTTRYLKTYAKVERCYER